MSPQMTVVLEDWHYAHQGTDWDHYSKVNLGKFQSPIDLPIKELMSHLDDPDLELAADIEIFYDSVPEAYCIDHQSHRSIRVTANSPSNPETFIPLGQIIVDGKVFKVDQWHLHAPAEHLFDGCREPLELHIVHTFDGYVNPPQTSDTTDLLTTQSSNESSTKVTKISNDYSVAHEHEVVVVGIHFSSSVDACNPFLNAFLSIKDFPFKPGARIVTEVLKSNDDSQPSQPSKRPPLDLASLLFSSPTSNEQTASVNFARYFGSFTTPPLHEVVHWFVRCEPIPASPQQLDALASSMKYHGTHGNYRCCDGRRGHPRRASSESVLETYVSDLSSSSPSFIEENDGRQYVWLVKGCNKSDQTST